jgi:hypothetical protein
MRQILHGDVVAAATVITRLAPDLRAKAVWRMLEGADAADRYRKRLGRPHPRLGNGSLMAAARNEADASEPFLSDLEYLRCVEVVIQMLVKWRLRVGISDAETSDGR